MNFRKLLTYLTMGTAAAMPIATAQNPTILQGSYISNVFGNSNFVLNPNAQTNVANVTVSSATVSRSTTTPLVATSEFTITTSTATGYADWSLRAFDQGMKGQNCEARFTYRGFSVGTTTAQILQGTNVVAQLALTASTDPRIASINFPCGDLSAVTKFRLQQATASLTGTNEISAIYTGLATNMANVAQAEFVGSLAWPNTSASDSRTSITWEAFQTVGSVDPTPVGNVTSPNRAPRITVPSLKAGNYRITFVGNFLCFSATNVDSQCGYRITDGTTQFGTQQAIRSLGAINGNQGQATTVLEFDFQYTGATTSKTFQLETIVNATSTNSRVENGAVLGALQISVYRFPSSSELVVTPERQNVFGGIRAYSGSNTNSVTSASWTKLTASTTLTREVFGKADSAASNDLSITLKNLPVGTYEIKSSGVFQATASGSGNSTFCAFGISDLTSPTNSLGSIQVAATGDVTSTTQEVDGSSIIAIYNNTSVADRTFTIFAQRLSGAGSCSLYSIQATRPWVITVTPLDQPSNSALYVQGPVLSAQTGSTISAGYVGQKLDFTAAIISANTTDFTANATALTTLTPGTWMIVASAGTGGGASTTGYGAFIASGTNNANDQWLTSSNDTSFAYDPNFGGRSQMVVLYYNATTSTPIYAKAKAYGANQTITIRGYAVRIN